jgi:hypothetical protein
MDAVTVAAVLKGEEAPPGTVVPDRAPEAGEPPGLGKDEPKICLGDYVYYATLLAHGPTA